MDTFYLGGDVAALGWALPVMVSHGRLRTRVTMPRATAPWWLDSRGFTELQQNGRWTISPRQYVADARRYRDEIGQLVAVSPQDWMCEPIVISGGWFKNQYFVGTHLSVDEHQQRTVENLLLLRELAPDLPIVPVLQGWTLADYLRCIDLYAAHGIDLRDEPIVGLGSVCRRQASGEIDTIVGVLAAMGLNLHGFGVKTEGIDSYGPLLASADSFAWSYGARRRVGLCPHGRGIKWEANCPEWARAWRTNVLARIGSVQLGLDLFGAVA